MWFSRKRKRKKRNGKTKLSSLCLSLSLSLALLNLSPYRMNLSLFLPPQSTLPLHPSLSLCQRTKNRKQKKIKKDRKKQRVERKKKKKRRDENQRGQLFLLLLPPPSSFLSLFITQLLLPRRPPVDLHVVDRRPRPAPVRQHDPRLQGPEPLAVVVVGVEGPVQSRVERAGVGALEREPVCDVEAVALPVARPFDLPGRAGLIVVDVEDGVVEASRGADDGDRSVGALMSFFFFFFSKELLKRVSFF